MSQRNGQTLTGKQSRIRILPGTKSTPRLQNGHETPRRPGERRGLPDLPARPACLTGPASDQPTPRCPHCANGGEARTAQEQDLRSTWCLVGICAAAGIVIPGTCPSFTSFLLSLPPPRRMPCAASGCNADVLQGRGRPAGHSSPASQAPVAVDVPANGGEVVVLARCPGTRPGSPTTTRSAV